jgi:hypothetical protein
MEGSDSRIEVFAAECGPSVTTGSDLIDVTNLVRVELRASRLDEAPPLLQAATEPAEVDRLGQMVATSPVELGDWDGSGGPNQPIVVFVFANGTVIVRSFELPTGSSDATSGRLEPGVLVPAAFLQWAVPAAESEVSHDYLVYNGRLYLGSLNRYFDADDLATMGADVDYELGRAVGRPLLPEELGPVVVSVERLLDDQSELCGRVQNLPVGVLGASALPAGTELRSVPGFAPHFRLAAVVEGEVKLYEAACGPAVRTGADLIDLGTLARLEVRGAGGRPSAEVFAVVDDPTMARHLADLILAAPVEYDNEEYYLVYDSIVAHVVFFFEDGTASAWPYFATTRMLGRGVRAPEEVWSLIERAARDPLTPPVTVVR